MKRTSSENRFTVRLLENLEDIRKGENNIVLFGSVGNGKTFLLNKLCGTSYPTADDGYSCTRTVQFAYSLNHNMVIIDFPGLNAVKDIVGHLKTQKTALSAIPIRMICFIIKYSSRNDDFERELSQMLYIFNSYTSNITIIISKSEKVNSKTKEEIKFLFKNRFGIENTIFTTKKTNGYDLCDEFNKLKNKMENIKQIIVKTRDLAKTVPSLYNKDMAKEKELYEDKFYDALENFKKEVEKATDPDLKRALYFAFKDYKDKLLEEYTNTIKNKKIDGKEPDPDSVVAEVLMFDNQIFNEFNEFRKSIESQIEVKSSNYNGEYNRFKKCPHCGLIWFKIKGCDSVVCGKRTKAEDKIVGKYKKYTVTYVDNKVIITFQDIGEDAKMMNNMNFNRMLNTNRILSNNQMMNPMMSNNNMSQFNQMSNPMLLNNNISQNNLMANSMMLNNNMSQNMQMMMNMMSNNNNLSLNNPMMNMMSNNDNFSQNNQMMNMMSNNNNISQNNPMMMNMMSNDNNNSPHNQMTNMMNMMNMMNNMNLNYEDDDEFVGLTKKENLENLQREKEGKIKIQPFGCGRSLNWKDMEDVSDDVILKLKEIAIDDYHAGFLNISEKINP